MNTKEHILRETFSLMNRLGVQAMTMDMVAAACGMSKRTLYGSLAASAALWARPCAWPTRNAGAT